MSAVLAQSNLGEGSEEMGRRLAEKLPSYIDTVQAYAGNVAENPLLAALPLAGLAVVGGTALLAPVGFHHARHSLSGKPSDLRVGDRLEKGLDEWFSMPVWLSWLDRCMHTMTMGPTGSGKTTALMPWMIQDLLAGRSVVIVQVQGDLAQKAMSYARALGSEILAFDLTDPANSLKFNPVAGDKTEEVAERMASAMRAAVGEQAHFEAVAEDITRNTTILARQYAAHTGYRESDANIELMQLLLLDRDFLEEVLGVTYPQGENGKPTGKVKVNAPWLDPYVATWFEQDYLRWNSSQLQQNTVGVKMVLRRVLATEAARTGMCPAPGDRVLDLAAEVARTANRRAPGDDPTRGKLIVLNVHGVGPEPASAIAHWAIKNIGDATLTRAEDADPLCVYLDELPTMVGDGHPQALRDFNAWLANVRKLQVAVTVAFQGWSQLPKALSDSLDLNCRNKLIAGGGSEADIQKLKRMLGEDQYVMSESFSPSSLGPDHVRSRSRRKEERSRLTYDQILRLRREEWIWMGTKNNANLAPVKLRTSPPKPPKAYRKRTPRNRRSHHHLPRSDRQHQREETRW